MRVCFPFILAMALGCGVEQPGSERYTDLPFVLSEEFTSSGFMGAAATPSALTLSLESCPSRPEGARGHCYTFVFDPTIDASVRWAGVAWQSPSNNWGDMPPKRVEPGAQRVRLMLRGSRAEGSVGLTVGGNAPVIPKPYADSFIRVASCPLSTEWTACEVDLSDASYDQVLNAFSWAYEARSEEPITIYFDDIVWE